MPVVTEMEVEARSLRKGDFLVLSGARVTNVDNKTKWTFVSTHLDSVNVKVLRESLVRIAREIETPEEEAVRAIQRSEKECIRRMAESKEAVTATVENIIKTQEWDLASQYGPMTDHLQAVAERDFWNRVERRIENGATIGCAVLSVADECMHGLVNDEWTSNSTNAVSNAANAMKRKMASRFAQSFMVMNFREYLALTEES